MECTVTVPPFGMVSMMLFPVPAPVLILRFTVVLLVPVVLGAVGVDGAGAVGVVTVVMPVRY